MVTTKLLPKIMTCTGRSKTVLGRSKMSLATEGTSCLVHVLGSKAFLSVKNRSPAKEDDFKNSKDIFGARRMTRDNKPKGALK